MRDAIQDGNERRGGDPALLIRLAWATRWQSRSQSIAYAEQSKVLLRGRNDDAARVHRALADVTLAWQAKWRGDFDDALAYALIAEESLSEQTYPTQRAELYSIMGVVHYSRHRLDLANCAVSRGLKLVSPELGTAAYVDLLTSKATIHRHAGDFKAAGEVLGQARKISTGVVLARVEHNIARWMLADDAPMHALSHAEKAIELGVEHQNNVILPYAHEVAGACHVELEQYDRAEVHFSKALGLATADKDARAQCQILCCFAALESKRDSFERARDLYRYGREIATSMEYALWEKTFLRRLADVYEALGDLANSVECHKRAWKLEEEKRQ